MCVQRHEARSHIIECMVDTRVHSFELLAISLPLPSLCLIWAFGFWRWCDPTILIDVNAITTYETANISLSWRTLPWFHVVSLMSPYTSRDTSTKFLAHKNRVIHENGYFSHRAYRDRFYSNYIIPMDPMYFAIVVYMSTISHFSVSVHFRWALLLAPHTASVLFTTSWSSSAKSSFGVLLRPWRKNGMSY